MVSEETNPKSQRCKKIGIACLVGGLFAGLALGKGINTWTGSLIPYERNVTEGYVQPAYFKIWTEDLDGDGVNETLVRYGFIEHQTYLFRLDERGRPAVYPYSVREKEIIVEE